MGRFGMAAICVLLGVKSVYAMQLDKIAIKSDEIMCAKINLYHEARGETFLGMMKIMDVVMSRVSSDDFPNNICDVVWQGFDKKIAQFSWTNDGKYDHLVKSKDWSLVSDAVDIYMTFDVFDDADQKILYYQAGPVTNWFKKALKPVTKVGNHTFWKEK